MSEAQINRFQQNVLDAVAAGGVQGGSAAAAGTDGAGDSGGQSAGDADAGTGDEGGAAGADGAGEGGTVGTGKLSLDAGADGAADKSDKSDKSEQGKGGESPEGDKGPDAPLEIKLPDQMPEGVVVDQKMIEAFVPVFKEVGLDSEKASAIVAKFVEIEGQRAQAFIEQRTQIGAGWEASLVKDLGKDGAVQAIAGARSVLREHGGQALIDGFKEMELHHLLSFPPLVRVLASVHEQYMAEDRGGGGSKPAGGPVSKEERLARFYDKSQ